MEKNFSPGYRAAQFSKLLRKVVGGTVKDFYRGRGKTLSPEDLVKLGLEPSDEGELEELVISALDARGLLATLEERFSREKAVEQWHLFQAARAVTEEGVDPLDTRSFYDALHGWLQSHRPQSAIKRENIRVYWYHLCHTLREGACREGVKP